MEKNAVISVKSFSDLDENEAIEVVTPGKFWVKENGFEAIYEESKLSGMEGTTTYLRINEDSLILEREGSTATKMEFKIGEDSISLYNTPYGMLNLHIETKELDINIDDNGGKIYSKYILGLEGNEGITTELTIRINAR